MLKHIKKFNTHAEYVTFTQGANFVKPNVSSCVDNREVHYNPWTWAEEYLTFVALESGTFTLSENPVSYSLDDGETWTVLTAGTPSPTVTTGNKIMWKGNLTPMSNKGIGRFSSTGQFDVKGNPMSLLYGDNFKGQTDLTGKDYAFNSLFRNNTNVVSAKDLSLPATTLASNCYQYMFQGCTSLTTAPELTATTLSDYCYAYMFRNCTSLTTTPKLSATTLASNCYHYMFGGCTGLTTAPELSATTLASNCYQYMFSGCTGLTTAPELSATTLESGCYSYMFQNCTNLNYIKAMFTTTPSGGYTTNWVSGVAASGTFVKNSAAQWDVTGVNGIPSGWTVETASE